MRKSKAPGDRRFCDLAYFAGFTGFAGYAGYTDYADFTDFGTEALIVRSCVHVKLHFPGNLVFRDESVLELFLYTESFSARTATCTIHTVLSFFCGRYFSNNIILYRNPTQMYQKTNRNLIIQASDTNHIHPNEREWKE